MNQPLPAFFLIISCCVFCRRDGETRRTWFVNETVGSLSSADVCLLFCFRGCACCWPLHYYSRATAAQ